MACKEPKMDVMYKYDINKKYTNRKFYSQLKKLLREHMSKNQELVLVCIGSDRATGDCLAPLVGTFLSKSNLKNVYIYGTLENTVHAKNLVSTLEDIQNKHNDAFVIAIDASLGREQSVGHVTIGVGSLYPGSGVNKDLPPVGDMYITGIVNISGEYNHMLLQTTPLNIVMQLSEFISDGLSVVLGRKNINKIKRLMAYE